jgi:hypothetical protein
MKKVAATSGQSVSLAAFFFAAKMVREGSWAGSDIELNFYSRPPKRSSLAPLRKSEVAVAEYRSHQCMQEKNAFERKYSFTSPTVLPCYSRRCAVPPILSPSSFPRRYSHSHPSFVSSAPASAASNLAARPGKARNTLRPPGSTGATKIIEQGIAGPVNRGRAAALPFLSIASGPLPRYPPAR